MCCVFEISNHSTTFLQADESETQMALLHILLDVVNAKQPFATYASTAVMFQDVD